MSDVELLSNAIFMFFVLIVAVIAIPVSFSLEKNRKSFEPNASSYKWGFFNGCLNFGVAAPISVLLVVAALFGDPDVAGEILFYAGFSAFLSSCGWFIIKRKRWAWVCGTFLALNPIAWIINGTYAYNRWKELE